MRIEGEEILAKTVNEVSKLAGVSIRTLQYYDSIGLLKPSKYTESGYRLMSILSVQKNSGENVFWWRRIYREY